MDEDLIALSKRSRFTDFYQVLEAIRHHPKTVRAAVLRGSGGHLVIKLILEKLGIPQQNLNLVTYNSGGQARAAVAGGVVDFIAVSAKGSEGIREFLNPQAIVSDQHSTDWGVPTLTTFLQKLGVSFPVVPGSIRGFATSARFRENYPERFVQISEGLRESLNNDKLKELLARAEIQGRWYGPEKSEQMMIDNFNILEKYSYLLR